MLAGQRVRLRMHPFTERLCPLYARHVLFWSVSVLSGQVFVSAEDCDAWCCGVRTETTAFQRCFVLTFWVCGSAREGEREGREGEEGGQRVWLVGKGN